MEMVLCDDHVIVRDSIAKLFEARGHRVTATTDHPSHLPALVARDRPDVCVTDLLFEGETDPAQVYSVIEDLAGATDVVVLTGMAGDQHRLTALRAGAAAVGSKALTCDEIIALVEGRCDAPVPRSPVVDDPFGLTGRECEVLARLCRGDSTARIAETLGMRLATARSHVQNVLLKLGVHSRLAAVAVAVEHDLVEVET